MFSCSRPHYKNCTSLVIGKRVLVHKPLDLAVHLGQLKMIQTKYEYIPKVNVQEQTSQSISIATVLWESWLYIPPTRSCTAKWIWDRSTFSILKPSFDIIMFQDFWKVAQICKKFVAFERKIVFVIVSAQFCKLRAQNCFKRSVNFESKLWFHNFFQKINQTHYLGRLLPQG